ncbi:hypothetical protein ACSTHY_00175 [Vibrio parahaemolyticus]
MAEAAPGFGLEMAADDRAQRRFGAFAVAGRRIPDNRLALAVTGAYPTRDGFCQRQLVKLRTQQSRTSKVTAC